MRLERKGNDRLVGLPYEYFVPSITGMFQEMYYWDTFFSAKGLFLSGREALVKNSVDDMFYLVDKFGYMPNGSHMGLISRSQPPFLCMMVSDVYDVYKDNVWLRTAYEMLKKEYDFWMTERITPSGLNRYGYIPERGNPDEDLKMIKWRLSGYDFSGRSDQDIVENVMCDAESGWDFNPRCDMHQTEFNYVDLNSNLYIYEMKLSEFAKILNTGEEEKFAAAAKARKEKIRSLMFDGEKFLDYNYKTGEHSRVFTCASFFPLWAKAASEKEAESTVSNLKRIECDFGVAACEKGERNGVIYQWDYPNGWAPLHYIVVHALDNYGYREDAARIAEKYTGSMEKIFAETGTLWEKYNVVDGSIKVNDEYKMPEMLGWTAGVYLDLLNYLGKL